MRSRKAPSSLASAACIVVSNWLSWASSAASLRSTNSRDVLDVVRLVGLPQQQRRRAVRGEAVLGEEVRIAGGDDGVAHEPAGVAVVGVQPVALPRVVAEHDVGPQLADDRGRPRDTVARSLVEVAVDAPEEAHLAGAVAGQPAGRLALLVLAARDERRQVGDGVPRALRAVGAHEVVDDAAGGRPLGERAAGAELDVVGMGGDGQRRRRHRAGRASTTRRRAQRAVVQVRSQPRREVGERAPGG